MCSTSSCSIAAKAHLFWIPGHSKDSPKASSPSRSSFMLVRLYLLCARQHKTGAGKLVASVRWPPMRVNMKEAVQIPPLKGDQISAQGFNPGLGNSRRCALKGHQNPARHIGSKSFACVSAFSRHFQGAFLRGGHPGLKPWAELFCPFGAETLYPSLSSL